MFNGLKRNNSSGTLATEDSELESQSAPIATEDVDYGHGIRVAKPLGLASPFKFDSFFRTVRAHAYKDQASQSLDRFLIEGDGQELLDDYRTPFQESLPNRVDLLKNELLLSEHELAIKATVQLHDLEMGHRKADEQVQNVSTRLTLTQADLDLQESILRGEMLGRDGIFRPGQLLAAGNATRDFFRIHSAFFTLLLVGLVDAGVLIISLADLLGQSFEGLLFSVPAIGIQVLFPHLIGEKLALVLGGSAKRQSEAWFMALLLLVWGSFVAFISIIRGNFVAQEKLNAARELKASGVFINENAIALEILTLQLFIPVVLAGLGIWLIFHAYRANPHELEFLKLKKRELRVKRELNHSTTARANASERLRIQNAAIESLKDLNQTHLSVMDRLYSKVGNQVYERVLVNVFGNPDYTTKMTKQNKPLRKKI